jgi:hypothetical protein
MSATPTNPLHLLRALLRECTYLPDPHARKYIHEHVLSAFRNYLPKIKEWRKEVPLPRQVSLLHRGRQSLSLLRRANEGEFKPLHKILSMTYGRRGKRRRELMAVLMAPEIPQNSEALENLKLQAKYTREWKPPAQLSALMRSQSQQVDYLGENKRKVKAKLEIPETNLWGKKMPKLRVKNTTRKWYAKQTDYIFPPLPENERQDLRALATGEREWWPILRRAQLGRRSALDVFEQGLQQTILDGPQKGRKVQEAGEDGAQKLTHRLMRRLWAYVYRHVPTMAYFPETQRWRVYWHDVSRRPGPILGSVMDESQDVLLFGDVDDVEDVLESPLIELDASPPS